MTTRNNDDNNHKIIQKQNKNYTEKHKVIELMNQQIYEQTHSVVAPKHEHTHKPYTTNRTSFLPLLAAISPRFFYEYGTIVRKALAKVVFEDTHVFFFALQYL